MALPPLLLKIGADTKDLERSIERVQDDLGGLQRTSDKVARGLNKFGDGATNLGRRMLPLSAGITAAAGGAFLLARNTAAAGDEIAKAARASGVGADDFQELRFAMGQVAGMSEGQFASALQYLNRQMGEAANGNDRAADALAAVGVSMEDVQSGAVDAADVMQMFADNAGDFETSADAAQVAAALFGRSGATLGPILREAGDEVSELRQRFIDLGLGLSDDTLDAAEEFTDKFDEVRQQMRAVGSLIGAALLPVMVSLADSLQEKVIPGIVSMIEGVRGAIEWFGDLPGPVQEAAGIVAAALGVGGPVLMAVGAMSKALAGLVVASGPVGLLIAAAGAAVWAWRRWGDDIKRIVGNAAKWFEDRFGGIIDAGEAIFDGLQAQVQNFIDLFRAAFQGDLKGVIDSLFSIFAQPLQSIAAVWMALGVDIKDAVGGALDWAKDKFNSFLDFVAGIPGKFRDIGRAIMDGLRQGINEAWESVKASIQEKVDWLPDWVKDRLGIASPSKVFSDIGYNIGEGMAEGIRESTPLAQEAMREMTEGLLGDDEGEEGEGGIGEGGPMQDLVERFREFGERTGQSFADGLRSTMDLARQAVLDIGSQITDGAESMAAGVVGAMADMFKGSKPIAIAQSLINTYQGITEALKTRDFASAARIAAQGFAAVASIRSTSPSGGGGGGRSGGGGRGGGAAAEPSPGQNIRFEIVGEGPAADAAFRTLELVQEALDNGGRIEGLVAERVGA